MGIKSKMTAAVQGVREGLQEVAGDYLLGRTMRQIMGEVEEDAPRSREEEILDRLEAEMSPEDDPEIRKLLEAHGLSGHTGGVRKLSGHDLIRSMLYDYCAEDPEKILQEIGFSQISSEQAETIRKESDRRLDAVEPMHELVHLMANALMATHAPQMDGSDELAEESEHLAHGALAVLSQLVEMELIEILAAPVAMYARDPEVGEDD